MQIKMNEIIGKSLQGISAPALDAAVAAVRGEDKILSGEGVTISTAQFTDLEKLVAQIKSESADTRANIARMRLASTIAILDAANIRLNADQTKHLAELTALNGQLDELDAQLQSLYAKYGATDATYSAILQAKIDELAAAVERAVQQGKDHNEAVEKATEQRDRDQAKLDKLQNAEKKDTAAIKAAKEALAASQATLDAATAIQAGDAAAIAAAQTALKTAKADLDTISEVKSKIAGLQTQIGAVSAKLGNEVLSEVASALKESARDVSTPEDTESAAETKKREEKELANDPLAIIRDSLNRIDEAIMRTIEGNRETTV